MNLLYTHAHCGEMPFFFFYRPVPDLIDTLRDGNNNDKLSSHTHMKDVSYSLATLSRPLIFVCAGNLFESTAVNLPFRVCTSKVTIEVECGDLLHIDISVHTGHPSILK
jgi:hypothetical protein